jgi:hypothetical protein
MPAGKPAGVVCANLDRHDQRCRIWGSEDYPQVCRQFMPAPEVCGASREQAIRLIDAMEVATRESPAAQKTKAAPP